MASELSQFIEKELQAQGIEDDEEQKLLSDLKVKPLSVDAAPLQQSSWSSRKNIMFLIGGIVLVALIIVGAGSYYKRGLTTRDIAQPDKTMPPLDSRGGDNPSPVQKQQGAKEYDEYEDDDNDDNDTNVVKKEEEKKKKKKKEADASKKEEDSAEYEDYDYSPDVKTPVKDTGAAKKGKDKDRRRRHRKLASHASALHHSLLV